MRRMVVALFVAAWCALVAGCGSNDLTLHYKLDGIAPSDVVRVETRVSIAPSDPRNFYVDQPFREVATGIGYEVRDVDGTGERTLLITHDATLGYVFSPTFEFRLLPPVSGTAPPLTINARAVGTSDMIGETMQLGAKFGGTSLTIDLTDQRCSGVACDPTNQICCSDACVDVQGDVANCGGCGMSCAPGGDSCSGATCRCAGGSACGAGSTCCQGVGCVDLQSDPFHCGTCDHACNPGETCSGGVCQCGSMPACVASTLCCSDGTCSKNGQCACGPGFCSFPDVCCNGACVDVKTSDANCGTCNNACSAPLACAGGACACNGVICAAGDTCCASGCANTSNDPNNCGACGTKCPAGEVCSGGQCLCGTTQCADGQLCCGNSCVNQGVTHCGSCANVCRMGETCTNGACSCNGNTNCIGNQVCCAPGSPGGAGCFDPSTDPKHCGDCGTQCPSGDACVLGKCTTSQCNPPCQNGNVCVGGQCRCNDSGGCNNNQTCCSSGCVDLTSDPQNCGMCGKQCDPSSPYCCDGVCTPPSSANCTGCGKSCGNGQSCCTCGTATPNCNSVCLCL